MSYPSFFIAAGPRAPSARAFHPRVANWQRHLTSQGWVRLALGMRVGDQSAGARVRLSSVSPEAR